MKQHMMLTYQLKVKTQKTLLNLQMHYLNMSSNLGTNSISSLKEDKVLNKTTKKHISELTSK